MEEFFEELYLFDNTIQLFLVQILHRRTKDSRFSHNSTSWVVEELCRRSVNRNELSWESARILSDNIYRESTRRKWWIIDRSWQWNAILNLVWQARMESAESIIRVRNNSRETGQDWTILETSWPDDESPYFIFHLILLSLSFSFVYLFHLLSQTNLWILNFLLSDRSTKILELFVDHSKWISKNCTIDSLRNCRRNFQVSRNFNTHSLR